MLFWTLIPPYVHVLPILVGILWHRGIDDTQVTCFFVVVFFFFFVLFFVFFFFINMYIQKVTVIEKSMYMIVCYPDIVLQ